MSDQPPQRVVIRGVHPEVECGRFPIKRTIGETVEVHADVFADGHDRIAAVVRYRHEDDEQWGEVPMEPLGNDHWRGQFPVERLGQYLYTISGWVDPFLTWYDDFQKRLEADQDVTVDLQIGMALLKEAAERALGADARKLSVAADHLQPGIVNEQLATLAAEYADRTTSTVYRELRVTVDPVRARFSTWYEMFPRSCGTFADCERILPEIAEMGFDVLYFPPIHPIGGRIARGRTTTVELRLENQAVRGPSAARKVDTKRFIRNSARLKTFGASSRQRKSMASTLLSISLTNVHQIILMSRNIRNGFALGLTERSNMRKILPRSMKTSIRSNFEIPALAKPCGRNSRASSNSGSNKVCTSFGSTILIRSLRFLGMDDSRSEEEASGSDLPG